MTDNQPGGWVGPIVVAVLITLSLVLFAAGCEAAKPESTPDDAVSSSEFNPQMISRAMRASYSKITLADLTAIEMMAVLIEMYPQEDPTVLAEMAYGYAQALLSERHQIRSGEKQPEIPAITQPRE